MSFGLTNVLASFTDLMNQLFNNFFDTFVIVFTDDILIYSKTEKEHEDNLRKILTRLRTHKLYANSLSEFWLQEVAFLQQVVSSESIYIDPVKVDEIMKFSWPTIVTEVRSFLGFKSYYRRFIKDFPKIFSP